MQNPFRSALGHIREHGAHYTIGGIAAFIIAIASVPSAVESTYPVYRDIAVVRTIEPYYFGTYLPVSGNDLTFEGDPRVFRFTFRDWNPTVKVGDSVERAYRGMLWNEKMRGLDIEPVKK